MRSRRGLGQLCSSNRDPHLKKKKETLKEWEGWRQGDQLRDYGCDSGVCYMVEMWLARDVMEDIWQEILIRRDTGQREVELKVSSLSY